MIKRRSDMVVDKIRVMVVDDSVMFRTWLITNLSKDSRFDVVGYAVNAMDAMNKLPIYKPDVMTLDIEMPGMTGLDFLKQMLPKHPIPVVLVSSLNVQVFDALAAGAVDFARKPDDENQIKKDVFLSTLSGKIVIASHAHVRLPSAYEFTIANGAVTKRPAAGPSVNRPASRAPGSLGSRNTSGTANRFGNYGSGSYSSSSHAAAYGGGYGSGGSGFGVGGGDRSGDSDDRGGMRSGLAEVGPGVLSTAGINVTEDMVIAIGASTGGTEAILAVMRQFPEKIPGIVITQHMPQGFTAMYAERLNRLCQMEVREAKHGDRLRPGLALLAPGGLQMRLVRMGNGYSVSCSGTDKVSGHCPSVDVLFDSVANVARDKAIGIILTGMGADGAAGLLRMHKNGAYTIGQDKDTCIVYGMPMEAYKIGAVTTQAPLTSIPSVVISRLSKSGKG